MKAVTGAVPETRIDSPAYLDSARSRTQLKVTPVGRAAGCPRGLGRRPRGLGQPGGGPGPSGIPAQLKTVRVSLHARCSCNPLQTAILARKAFQADVQYRARGPGPELRHVSRQGRAGPVYGERCKTVAFSLVEIHCVIHLSNWPCRYTLISSRIPSSTLRVHLHVCAF
jgi:hypothetical protein